MWSGGNLRVVAALAEGTPVAYNSVVREVRCCCGGVAVRTATHEFKGEPCILMEAWMRAALMPE